MTDTSRKQVPLSSVVGGGAPDGRRCPRDHSQLYVTTTWRNADGTIRRLLKCHVCGYAVNSSEKIDA